MHTSKRKSLAVVLCTMAVVVAGALPAAAQQAGTSAAGAFGISLTGLLDLGPEPEVSASIPPGETDSDVLLEVPLEELLYSGTASVSAEASRQANITPALHTGGPVNARGYAVTENLTALAGDLLSADAVAAEAVVNCVAGQAQFSTSSAVANASLLGTALPLDEVGDLLAGLLDPVTDLLEPLLGGSTLAILVDQPNDVILEVPELGIRLIAWETNWDGGTGTSDGSDTVFVNALRLTISGALGDLLGDQDLIVSHAEASASACDLDRDPLGDITKSASSATVAPGSTFTYTIDVPNSDDTCTLTDVRVVDTITGPAGSSIVSTDPAGATVDGLTVTWEDIGPIAPGQSVRLTIGVQVPTNAPDGAQYSEQLRVTANCDGTEVDGGLDFTGPTVSAPAAPGGPPLPRTGGAAMLGGLVFMALGAGLLRLRS